MGPTRVIKVGGLERSSWENRQAYSALLPGNAALGHPRAQMRAGKITNWLTSYYTALFVLIAPWLS